MVRTLGVPHKMLLATKLNTKTLTSNTPMIFNVSVDSGDMLSFGGGDPESHIIVDWDNGIVEELIGSGTASITYSGPGTVNIKVLGTANNLIFSCPRFFEITSWGVGVDILGGGLFREIEVSFLVPLTSPPELTDFSYMFNGAITFNQDISSWDMSNATSVRYMFKNCEVYNKSLLGWDTSNVTDFTGMFSGCLLFNQQLNYLNISSTTSLERLLYNCRKFNTNLSGWSTGHITNMSYMFYQNSELNQLQAFDTSSVTNMSYMYGRCSVLHKDLSAYDVSNVTNMYGLFRGVSYPIIPTWSNPNVTDMSYIFYANRLTSIDLTNFGMASVTSMQGMFDSCFYLTTITGIDTSSLENASFMLSSCSAFNQDISNWDVSNVTNMYSMLQSTDVFNQDISNWDVSNVTNCGSFNHNGILNPAYFPAFTCNT